MRVGVQQAGPARGVHQEPHEEQAVVVALLLGALADHPGQRAGALQPLGDQHRAGLLHHVGHHDVVVSAELRGERTLGLGLELVVELLDGPCLHLGDQGTDVETRHQRSETAGHPAELAQVGGHGLGRAGVLHLDGDLAPVGPAPAVHLPDRGGRGGLGVEPDQVVLPVRPQLAGEDLAHRHGGHRRRGVLEPGQVLAVRRRDLVGQGRLEDRHRLAELHRPALEVSQRAEELLGGALLHLAQHGLRRGASDALAQAQRGAAGVPQRQRSELRGARHGLAGKFTHRPPWCPTRGHERSRYTTVGVPGPDLFPSAGRIRVEVRVRDHADGRRPSRWATTSRTAQAAATAGSTRSPTSGTPSARAREVART